MKYNNINQIQPNEEIDIKRIISLLLRFWHWLVLFGLLGLGIAFTYSQITKKTFSVSSSILIPEKSKEIDIKRLFNVDLEPTYTEIYNQIEIIKSSFTIKKTLQKLNWRTSWYKIENFQIIGLYKKEPYTVQETEYFKNPSGIKIYISEIDNNTYKIAAVGKIFLNEKKVDINFEANGKFGEPFRNKHFNFILYKNKDNNRTIVRNCFFEFNDITQATLAYQKGLKVLLNDDFSDLVICTITGTELEKDVDFLNELISVYTTQKMDFENQAQRRTIEFINSQLEETCDSLKISGNKYTEFRYKNEVIDIGIEGTIVMNKLKEIETEKIKNQLQLDYFKDLLAYLEKSEDLTQLVSPSVVGIEDASLNSLVIKLGELFNRRQILSFTAKANNPKLVLLDKELMQTRNRLTENLRNLVFNVTKTIASMSERQSMISSQLNKLPVKEQQLINIQRRYNLTNEIYNFLLQKRAETNISLASSIPDIQVIETASIETASTEGMSNKMILFSGLILGLVLPAGFILTGDFFNARIHNQGEIENYTQIPIIGNIIHSNDKAELTVFENPKSAISESFRELRTNIEFMCTGSGAKVISIHSTNPKEGKSFNSINLATILALNNNKVLLIDADLRKPKLHKVFHLENKHGLSTYLIGNNTFNQIIIPTSIHNLSILPSGPIPPNPAEILSKSTMIELLNWSRNQFDYIILDNAPIAIVTDGMILSRHSNLNIFILRFGISQKHQLEIIHQYSVTKKIANIGIILNDIKNNSFGNDYYKYYQFEVSKKPYMDKEVANKDLAKS